MSRRIPSLDGLRAVSIAMVLVGHAAGTVGFPLRPAPFAWGHLGVKIFFVISGYLITTLLLDEEARTGGISLGAFYVRRSLRIFPPFVAYAAAIVALERLELVRLRPGDLLAAATYTMNFHADRAWWLGHTWSLSVEEQFYLLWPAVIALLGARGGLRVALAAIGLAPLLRVAVFYGWPSQRPLVDQAFPLVFDALATGCALALLRSSLWRRREYRRLLGSPAFVAVPAAVAAAHLFTPSVGLSLLLGETVMHVGIALCVDWAMRFPDSAVGRGR
jgi:peptidoglycan/LPS O-acetylase OafA/YrhL